MRTWTTGFVAMLATLAGAATAQAGPIPITSVTPAQLLADFNVIVSQNINNANDIDGAVLAGGDLGTGIGPLNNKSIVLGTTAGTTAITGYGEINIFGNHTAAFNNTNGNVFVGGASSGTFPGATSVTFKYPFPPGATVAANPTTFQNNIWTPLTNLSNHLGTLSANSTLSVDPTTHVGTFIGENGANIAIFSVPLSALNGLNGTLVFAGCLSSTNPGGPCDAVIDITGSGTLNNPSFAFPLVTGGFPNIIVNFDNDVTVDVGNVWTASILDPLGSVSSTTDITGNVVATNFTTTAETHLPGFNCSGNLCVCPPGTPGCSSAPPIPTPEIDAASGGAAIALLLGVLALAGERRRCS